MDTAHILYIEFIQKTQIKIDICIILKYDTVFALLSIGWIQSQIRKCCLHCKETSAAVIIIHMRLQGVKLCWWQECGNQRVSEAAQHEGVGEGQVKHWVGSRGEDGERRRGVRRWLPTEVIFRRCIMKWPLFSQQRVVCKKTHELSKDSYKSDSSLWYCPTITVLLIHSLILLN